MLLRFFSFTAASAISPRLAPLTAISSSSEFCEPSSLLELSETTACRTLRFDDDDPFFFMGLLFADDPLFFGGLKSAVGVRICLDDVDVLPVTAAALALAVGVRIFLVAVLPVTAAAATAPSRPSLLVLRSCLSALLDFSCPCLLVSLRTVLMPCNRRPELSEKPFWIVLVSKYNPKRKSQSYYFENGIHLPTNPDDLSVTAAVSVASCNCSVLRSVAASESVLVNAI